MEIRGSKAPACHAVTYRMLLWFRSEKKVLPILIHITYPEYVLMNLGPLNGDEPSVCQ